ncbi:MAG: Coenzyme F420 hydrogenase/dehydrogenase, beta subunit C-terminal domain [bacterium]
MSEGSDHKRDINHKRPAGSLCCHCGLCLTSYARFARETCAFVSSRIERLERLVHGKGREINNFDHWYFGIYEKMMAGRMAVPIEGAQWTGVISSVASEMLKRDMVDGVICVHGEGENRLKPVPCLAFTAAEVLAARGNKPMLSANLSMLDLAQKRGIRRLLFIGSGCHVQALRALQPRLPFDKIYVLGFPCVDNCTPESAEKFLQQVSSSPDTVVRYEFMQDYCLQFIHQNGLRERVPFFSLQFKKLSNLIHPSCRSCFDYVNSLADLVVGYMGSPLGWQWIIVRNQAGQEMFEVIENQLELQNRPIPSKGKRRWALQMLLYVLDYNLWLPGRAASIAGAMARRIGPQGLEFARFSIDLHFVRNYGHVKRNYPGYVDKIIPGFARRIVNQYSLPGRGPFVQYHRAVRRIRRKWRY